MAESRFGWSFALASLGIVAGPLEFSAAAPATSPAILGSPEWKQIHAAVTEARRIAASEPYSYPFTKDEKSNLLRQLAEARKSADRLRDARLLNEPERELLKAELAMLTEQIDAFRYKEDGPLATCYKPMAVPAPLAMSLERLEQRLPLLEKLAAEERLHPAAMQEVLQTIRKDLATLASPQALEKADQDQRKKAERVARKADGVLKQIEGRMNARSLVDSPDWKTVTDAWGSIVPLAHSGLSTTEQRKGTDAKMEKARAAIHRLADQQLLTEAEAKLMLLEAERLSLAMYRNPPTDTRVTCYEMVAVLPARESLQRLASRGALLEKSASRLHPQVLARILPAMEADLAVFSSVSELERLTPEERTKAEELRQSIRKSLDAMRAPEGR